MRAAAHVLVRSSDRDVARYPDPRDFEVELPDVSGSGMLQLRLAFASIPCLARDHTLLVAVDGADRGRLMQRPVYADGLVRCRSSLAPALPFRACAAAAPVADLLEPDLWRVAPNQAYGTRNLHVHTVRVQAGASALSAGQSVGEDAWVVEVPDDTTVRVASAGDLPADLAGLVPASATLEPRRGVSGTVSQPVGDLSGLRGTPQTVLWTAHGTVQVQVDPLTLLVGASVTAEFSAELEVGETLLRADGAEAEVVAVDGLEATVLTAAAVLGEWEGSVSGPVTAVATDGPAAALTTSLCAEAEVDCAAVGAPDQLSTCACAVAVEPSRSASLGEGTAEAGVLTLADTSGVGASVTLQGVGTFGVLAVLDGTRVLLRDPAAQGGPAEVTTDALLPSGRVVQAVRWRGQAWLVWDGPAPQVGDELAEGRVVAVRTSDPQPALRCRSLQPTVTRAVFSHFVTPPRRGDDCPPFTVYEDARAYGTDVEVLLRSVRAPAAELAEGQVALQGGVVESNGYLVDGTPLDGFHSGVVDIAVAPTRGWWWSETPPTVPDPLPVPPRTGEVSNASAPLTTNGAPLHPGLWAGDGFALEVTDAAPAPALVRGDLVRGADDSGATRTVRVLSHPSPSPERVTLPCHGSFHQAVQVYAYMDGRADLEQSVVEPKTFHPPVAAMRRLRVRVLDDQGMKLPVERTGDVDLLFELVTV